jgi:triose/dihydroxyacetone kinase / FAD-AMP lyase (cyclizing)
LIQFSDVFSDGFGGSSGPLWGVFISKGATQLKQKLSENTDSDWQNAYNEGLKAMMNVGGAEKGDRTMVDALIFG